MDRQSYEMSSLKIFRKYSNTVKQPAFFKTMSYEWPTPELHGGKPYVRLVSLTTHPHKFSHFSGFERKKKDSGFVSGR